MDLPTEGERQAQALLRDRPGGGGGTVGVPASGISDDRERAFDALVALGQELTTDGPETSPDRLEGESIE